MKQRQLSSQHSRGCYLSLACSIGSIGMACGSLMQLNSTSDRISLQRGLFLISLGFIYFVSLTDFFNKYFLETRHGIEIRKKYRLMVSDAMDITNKIVSAVQAMFSCLAGAIACKSSCSKSFLYASHFVMEAYAWFGTAYFMYDIWSMYKVHAQKIADKLNLMKIPSEMNANSTSYPNGLYDKHTAIGDQEPMANNELHSKHHEDEVDYGEDVEVPKNGQCGFLTYVLAHPIMVMHHIFIGTIGLLVVTTLRGGLGDCVYSFIYLMEFSTPFVSARSILSTMGLKNTRMYLINGLVMLASFFVCRIFMWPYVFYWYSEVINKSFIQAVWGLPRTCKIGIMILFLPQIYWFSLMIKGALKVFLVTKRPEEEKSVEFSNTLKPTTTPIPNGTLQNHGLEENSFKRSSSPAKERTKDQVQGRSLM